MAANNLPSLDVTTTQSTPSPSAEGKQSINDQRISQHAHDILAVPRDTEFLQSFLRVDLGESESEGEEEVAAEVTKKPGGWLRFRQKKDGLSAEGASKDSPDQHQQGHSSAWGGGAAADDGQHHRGGRRQQHRESDGMLTGKKTTFSQLKQLLKERHGADGVVSPVPPGADAQGGGELGAMEQARSRRGKRRRARQRSREEVYTDKDRAAAVNLGTRDIKQSLKLKRKQDRSQAMQIPEEADPNAMLALGRRQMKAGRLSVALEFVNKALELQPEDVEALVSRSRCYLAVGQPGNALKDAEAALTVEPGYIRGIYQKAEALYHLGDFEHSLVFYHRGQRIRPEMECFRLGVQKAQEAIQNTIGKKGPQPKRKPSNAAFGSSKAKTPSLGKRTSIHSGNGHHKRNAPSSNGGSESGSRSSRQLLGELCIDKLYLENLLQHPDIKAPHQEGCKHISGPAEEAVAYLNGREEFWRQQKVDGQSPSTKALRPNRSKVSSGAAR